MVYTTWNWVGNSLYRLELDGKQFIPLGTGWEIVYTAWNWMENSLYRLELCGNSFYRLKLDGK